MRQRIVALDRRRDHAVDDLGDDRFARDRAEAVADDAGVGLDLDEASLERSFAINARKLDVQRDIEPGGADSDDFHPAHHQLARWRNAALAAAASLVT